MRRARRARQTKLPERGRSLAKGEPIRQFGFLMALAAKKTGPDPGSLLGWQILAPLTALFLVLVILFGLGARQFFEPKALERDLQSAERYANGFAIVLAAQLPQRSGNEILENLRRVGMENIQFLPPSQIPAWSSPRYMPVGPHVEAWAAVKDSGGSVVGAVSVSRQAEEVIFTEYAIRAFGAAACLSYALLAVTGWFLLKRRVSKRLAAIVEDVDPTGRLQLGGRDAVERVRDAVATTSAETSAREQHHRRLLEGHTELACLATPEGKLLDVNRAYCRFFGKERAELIGTSCLDLVHPSFRMDVVNRLQSASGAQTDTDLVHAVTRQDGSTSWLKWHATAIPSADGTATEILSFRTDITAQVAMEERLAGLQRAFDQMQSLAQTGSITWDFSADLMAWTPEAQRLLGCSTTPSLQALLDAVAPDDRETVRGLFLAAKKDGTEFDKEFRVVHPDGSVRILQSRAEVLADPKTKLLNHLTCTLRDITTLRQAEEATKRELQFRQAIEQSMGVGIAVVDDNGRKLLVNAALCQMTGWSEKELTGTYAPYPYWPEEEVPLIQEAFQKSIAGMAPKEGFELKFRRKEGTLFDGLVRVAPLLDGTGNRLGWLGAVTDVTTIQEVRRRLQSTEAALRSELRFREAVEAASATGTAVIDNEGRILAANRAFCEMVGLPESKVVGLTPPYPWWPESELRKIDAALKAAVSGRAPSAGFELQFQRSDGSLFDVQIRVAPLSDGSSKQIGWLSTIVDISSIQRTRRALAATEQELRAQLKYRDAVEKSVTVGLVAVGNDGRPFSANAALVKMLGFTEEEFKRMTPPYPYWPEESRGDIQRAFALDLAGKGPREGFELRFRRKDGTPVDVLITAAALTSPEGSPLGMLSAITDITALQTTRRELQVVNERLRIAQGVMAFGIWDWDPDHDTLHWDAASFALFGRPEASDPKEVWTSVLGEETREQLTYELKRLIAAGAESGQDRLFITWPDGSEHEILSTYIIVRDASRRATRVLGVNRDVTVEAEEERELRNAQERLIAALEGGQMGTFEHVIGVGDLNWNSANYEINGIDPSITEPGALFAAWKDVVGEFYPKLIERMSSLPITTNRYSYEFTAAPPGRTPRRVRVSVFIERNEQGHPTRLVGVTRRAEN